MRRLSSKSILIVSIDWFSKFILPIAINLVFNGRLFQGDKDLPRGVLFAILGVPALIGIFSIIGGVVTYMVTQFGVVDGSLIVKKRGLWRQERTIPLERIQNVAITQSLLERILSVATVKVETAGGAGAEASLKSLSLKDADVIKSELLQVHLSASSPDVDLLSNQVYRAEWQDIALAGALQNKGLIVFLGLIGLVGQGVDDLVVHGIKFTKQSHLLERLSENPTLSFFVVTGSSILFVLFGWMLSIAYTLSIFHGFKVIRTEAGLQVSYGFFTTTQTIVPLRRVQSIEVKSSWLFRLFGFSQLFARTIGSPTAGAEGYAAGASTTLLAPISKPDVLRTLIRLINPRLDVQDLQFKSVNPYYKPLAMRWLFGLPVILLVQALLVPHFRLPALLAYALITGLGSWMILMSYKRHGYASTDDAIFVSSGTFGQDVVMIPFVNVQSMTFESGWALRRKGLTDLRISTPVSDTCVRCINLPEAKAIFDLISHVAFRSKTNPI